MLAAGLLLAAGQVSKASTEAEKQAAIDAGLTWLAAQQQVDGSWWYGGGPDAYVDIATTAAALLAFIEEGHTPSSATAYSFNVANGLDFLLSYAQSYAIAGQPAGDPDLNSNGIGVKFSPVLVDEGRDIYQTGLAIMPIAAVGTPAAVITQGPQTGRTYADVIQDTADYLAFAQNEASAGHPNARGGWRYFANSSVAQGSDNSTSQWPTVGLLYAQSAGAAVPAFVASELAIWASFIQNVDGGSDYDDTKGWGSNVSRTGTLLVQQVFSGAVAGMAAAQAYLDTQWLTTANSSTWNGNFGHPYAMWAAYKGLEVTIGVDADQSVIGNLHPDPGDLDNPNHGWNWWEDYCEYLVSTQNPSGYWPGYGHWPMPLATAWYVNILAATEVPPPNDPPACSGAYADPMLLRPANHKMVPVSILGVTDPDGDPVTITITMITSDEPTAPDTGTAACSETP